MATFDLSGQTIRQALGVAVVLFIMFIVVSAAFIDTVSITDTRIRLLILLAGGLLGVDGARKIIIEDARRREEKD